MTTANTTDRRIQIAAGVFVALYALLGIYAAVAILGYAPVAPWSPVGEAREISDRPGLVIAPQEAPEPPSVEV